MPDAVRRLILLARSVARDYGAEAVRKYGAREAAFVPRIDANEHGTVIAALATAARVILRELPKASAQAQGWMAGALLDIAHALELEPNGDPPPEQPPHWLQD